MLPIVYDIKKFDVDALLHEPNIEFSLQHLDVLIYNVYNNLLKKKAVIPVIKVKDSIKLVEKNYISKILIEMVYIYLKRHRLFV